jgi:hypothetical protein
MKGFGDKGATGRTAETFSIADPGLVLVVRYKKNKMTTGRSTLSPPPPRGTTARSRSPRHVEADD